MLSQNFVSLRALWTLIFSFFCWHMWEQTYVHAALFVHDVCLLLKLSVQFWIKAEQVSLWLQTDGKPHAETRILSIHLFLWSLSVCLFLYFYLCLHTGWLFCLAVRLGGSPTWCWLWCAIVSLPVPVLSVVTKSCVLLADLSSLITCSLLHSNQFYIINYACLIKALILFNHLQIVGIAFIHQTFQVC